MLLKNQSQTLSVVVVTESCWKILVSLSVVVTKLLKHHSQTLSVVVIIECCWKIKLWVVVVVIESC